MIGRHASAPMTKSITTTPNELLEPIHDRMPVILTADAYEAWLRETADPRALKALLAPYPAAAMKSSGKH